MIPPLPAAVLAVFCAFAVIRLAHCVKSWKIRRFSGSFEPRWVQVFWVFLALGTIGAVVVNTLHHTSEFCAWMGRLVVPIPPFLRWIGFGVAVFGLMGLHRVHLALGAFFSAHLKLRDDHTLVTTGPYAKVRHPMYTALLVCFGGSAILAANLAISGLCLAISAMLILRIRLEERMLEDRFGQAYRDYRKKTGCLLPKGFQP